MLVAAVKGCGGNCRPGGFMTHVTCRLTAKNRVQLRNPTLGNRVWATFTFFTSALSMTARYSALAPAEDIGR